MTDKYVLVGQTPVPVDDLLTWARECETMDRRVAYTRVLDLVDVSTVFLGLDHSCGYTSAGPHRPLLFETMAFWRDEHGWEQERCSTWTEAEAQHREMVRAVASWRSVLAYFWRRCTSARDQAISDWKRSWRDLRGIEQTETEREWERIEREMIGSDRWT